MTFCIITSHLSFPFLISITNLSNLFILPVVHWQATMSSLSSMQSAMFLSSSSVDLSSNSLTSDSFPSIAIRSITLSILSIIPMFSPLLSITSILLFIILHSTAPSLFRSSLPTRPLCLVCLQNSTALIIHPFSDFLGIFIETSCSSQSIIISGLLMSKSSSSSSSLPLSLSPSLSSPLLFFISSSFPFIILPIPLLFLSLLAVSFWLLRVVSKCWSSEESWRGCESST